MPTGGVQTHSHTTPAIAPTTAKVASTIPARVATARPRLIPPGTRGPAAA